jgi:hypothetical protein
VDTASFLERHRLALMLLVCMPGASPAGPVGIPEVSRISPLDWRSGSTTTPGATETMATNRIPCAVQVTLHTIMDG